MLKTFTKHRLTGQCKHIITRSGLGGIEMETMILLVVVLQRVFAKLSSSENVSTEAVCEIGVLLTL